MLTTASRDLQQLLCVEALSYYVIKPTSSQALLSRRIPDSDHSPVSADTHWMQKKQQQLRTTPLSAPVHHIANMLQRPQTADLQSELQSDYSAVCAITY